MKTAENSIQISVFGPDAVYVKMNWIQFNSKNRVHHTGQPSNRYRIDSRTCSSIACHEGITTACEYIDVNLSLDVTATILNQQHRYTEEHHHHCAYLYIKHDFAMVSRHSTLSVILGCTAPVRNRHRQCGHDVPSPMPDSPVGREGLAYRFTVATAWPCT